MTKTELRQAIKRAERALSATKLERDETARESQRQWWTKELAELKAQLAAKENPNA